MILLEDLRDQVEHVILHVGDMIYDVRTKSRGFLKSRERKIDLVDDDIYVWTVVWLSHLDRDFNNLDFMEEEGLKISIRIGTIELTSIEQGG